MDVNVLSLDISTSIVGWCVFDSKGKLSNAGYVDLTNISHNSTDELFNKVDYLINKLSIIIKPYKISYVVIESPIGMATGKNINSAILLNRFNYMISYYFHYKKYNVKYVSSQHARSVYMGEDYKFWIKIPKGDPKKEYISKLVKDELSKYIEYKYRPRATTKLLPHIYDVSDAFVVGKSFFLDK